MLTTDLSIQKRVVSIIVDHRTTLSLRRGSGLFQILT